ncbi:nucleoside hydrolase [Shigella boydii]
MALPIPLNCDRGDDDAIAIVLALASPELDVKAITSSAGNQTPEKTLRNVLHMLTLLIAPIFRSRRRGKTVNAGVDYRGQCAGESGLDGPALPEPAFAPQNCTAVGLMAKTLRESAEPDHDCVYRTAN